MPNGDHLPETWTTRELPILRRILARFDSGDHLVDARALQSELPQIPPGQLRVGLRALDDAGYLDFQPTMGGPNRVTGHISAVHERARRELGTWPTPEALVAEIAIAFESAAEAEPEPERRGRLKAAADALGGFGSEVAAAVVARHLGA